MARVVPGRARGAVDPLKHSQPLGGALVFLGLDRAIPLLHGSQGCTAFAKALLTRHFREPIPLQSSAVTEVSAVIGAGEALTAALEVIRQRHHPEIIGVLTTGLTEVSGEDVAGELRSYLARTGEDTPLVVGVSTPDFTGGLSDGYAAALHALIRAVPLAATPVRAAGRDRLAVLAGPALTAADTDELAEWGQALGYEPVVVPELAGSLDGHLADGWSPLTTGGTTLPALRRLGDTAVVLGAGLTVADAAAELAGRTGAQLIQLPHLCGLAAVDEAVARLTERTGAVPPPRLRRWRARLADALLDAQFVLGGARVALALEPELLLGVATLLHEVGADIVAAVSPTTSPALAQLPCPEVVVGDLSDLAERAAAGGAELVVAGSHARDVAERVGAPLLELGFPIYDRLGPQLRPTAGYRGSLDLLFALANTVLAGRERAHHARRHRHGGDRSAELIPGGWFGAATPPAYPRQEERC